jgi:predicted double-glycine peptidase
VNAWQESFAVTLLALAGVGLGHWFSRLPRWYWTLGYFIPLLLLFLLWLPGQINVLFFAPPFSWLTAGRTEYAIAGVITTTILTTPLSRVTQPRLRGLVMAFMLVVSLFGSILPFAGPALIRGYLAGLKTNVDKDGVCLQSNDYNCGPAAAVTSLRRLGLPAEEGQLAIWAHTSSVAGTAPDVLAEAIADHYTAQGLRVEYRFLGKISELKGVESLAVIRYGFMVDHYVAVLELDERTITVGDPLVGRRIVNHEEFEKEWRHSAVILRRQSPAKSRQ